MAHKQSSKGGVKDLYYIPSNEKLQETDILDPEWWKALGGHTITPEERKQIEDEIAYVIANGERNFQKD